MYKVKTNLLFPPEAFLPGAFRQEICQTVSHSSKPFELASLKNCDYGTAKANLTCFNRENLKVGFAERKCHRRPALVRGELINLAHRACLGTAGGAHRRLHWLKR